MMNDFLFELGCEELPSKAVKTLSLSLQTFMTAALAARQWEYQSLRVFATPRRLAVLITGLCENAPVQTQIRRGPSRAAAFDEAGNPTKALLGFMRSCNAEIPQLKEVETDKGIWMEYTQSLPQLTVTHAMPALIIEALAALPITKPMRWGSSAIEFVRPVHWIVMLYADQVVEATVFGIKAGQTTYGHRFHHPQACLIASAAAYESLLKAASVMPDFEQRRENILQQLHALANAQGMQAVIADALLDEVTSIVEWPVALMVAFDPVFLQVPVEALIASMQVHQKCFALKNPDGSLCPFFITVSNIQSTNPQQIVAGNEKVMRARLSDAAFFFNQDKKQPLAARIGLTETVVFQEKLGSLADKVTRMEPLLLALSALLPALPLPQALRALALSQCDLMTGMVGEFPELQGIMGYYYALHDGEHPQVACALKEQYWPRFSGDLLPTSLPGLALSLIQRLDTLLAIFSIGQIPSGVKDPFKLRRHALATVRLLMALPATVPLSTLLAASPLSTSPLVEAVHAFILERLPAYYQIQGISAEVVAAVLATQKNVFSDMDKRVQALAVFSQQPQAGALSAACKRVGNVLQHAESASGITQLRVACLTEPAEKALWHALEEVVTLSATHYAQGDYAAVLTLLAGLKEPVDDFFDKVMVMVDDPVLRANRLALLRRLQALLQGVADIGCLS